MFMAVTLVTLITNFAQETTGLDTCVPNTRFQLNDRNCHCNSSGLWSETDCDIIGRRQYCMPGQLIWDGCRKCVCQENYRIFCSVEACEKQVAPIGESKIQRLDSIGPFCNKFRSYYINCSICTCPETGISAEALCVKDASCNVQKTPNFTDDKVQCIPSVMYIFQCFHCICSDQGLFKREKCQDTCQKPNKRQPGTCIKNTIYKDDCNVCLCPEDGIKDVSTCTNSDCKEVQLKSLKSIEKGRCIPHKFTKPKCMYCTCYQNRTVNRDECFKQSCLKGIDYSLHRKRCTPYDIVPICYACLCLRDGNLDDKFCTNACSDKDKLTVLEKVMNDNRPTIQLINRYIIEINSDIHKCEPGSIYVNHNGYCVCPYNGDISNKLCIIPQNKNYVTPNIKYNMPCTPNSFIEFDCNTCFCPKNGKIDPKWCTYDNCEAKRAVQHTTYDDAKFSEVRAENASCTAGSIYKQNCNYCICSESGRVNDSSCTTNICTQTTGPPIDEITFCEPLSYYQVDCNICYCSINGKKDLNRCTKNHCTSKKVLRENEFCETAQLFIDKCNLCVCPQNGQRTDSVCTKHECNEASVSWMKIYDISEQLLVSWGDKKPPRSLDTCCAGEEFPMGCNLCVCPEIGLRMYAECTNRSCDDHDANKKYHDEEYSDTNLSEEDVESRRQKDHCFTPNIPASPEVECDPGSMYFINCKECICPMNRLSIKDFCRPLPAGQHCENEYLVEKLRSRKGTMNFQSSKSPIVRHMHTKYKCSRSGTLMDKCFICQCEDNMSVVVEEHCFRNQEEECMDVRPTFLREFAGILG